MGHDRDPPLNQERNLDLIADHLSAAMAALPADQAGLALIAAGLDILPGGRCLDHYRAALLEVRREVDALLAELGATH